MNERSRQGKKSGKKNGKVSGAQKWIALFLAAAMLLSTRSVADHLARAEEEEALQGQESGIVLAEEASGAEPGQGSEPSKAEDSQGGASGAEPGQGSEPSKAEDSQGGEASSSEAGDGEGSKQAPEQDLGQIDLSIASALMLSEPVEFRVRLTDDQGNVCRDETIFLGKGVTAQSAIRLAEGLKKGTYTVTLSADGFVEHSQKIDVENMAYALHFTTGYLHGVDYAKGAAHPGLLQIGDVDGDGTVSQQDGKSLVDAIDSGAAPQGYTADLNRDGRTDLADLELWAAGYDGNGKDASASVGRSAPAKAIVPTVGEGTAVEGKLSDLLKNNGCVALKPQNDKPISEDDPVSLELDLTAVASSGDAKTDGIVIRAGRDNPISKGVVEIVYLDGQGKEQAGSIPLEYGVQHLLLDAPNVRVEYGENGNISIHLGDQIAIKKVTLTISGMKNNSSLVEISQVEFVNGMEERIPEPQMDRPENLKAEAGSKIISLEWDPCVNVTGYEVEVSQGSVTETMLTQKNSFAITSFQGKELVNYQEYAIRVQSVNGSWRSGYCDAVKAIPKPSKKPDKPDGVSAQGAYQSIIVSWKKMKDTISYNLYYKEEGADAYQKVEGIEGNSHTVNGLKDLTGYEAYVTGVNEYGESAPSLKASATTTDLNPAVMPRYKLINTGERGQKGDHIVSAATTREMKGSPLDTAGTAWGTVDHDPMSYYYAGTWDDGGFNAMQPKVHGLTYEFDQAYQLDTIGFHDITSRDTGLAYASVRYWDQDGKETLLRQLGLQRKTDKEGRVYYLLKLPQPIEAKKLQFALARSWVTGTISVAEVYFYHYDSLMEDIMGLYEDDLHTVLRPNVTFDTIQGLRDRINQTDPVSGEYHPDRELLNRELDTAEAILKDGRLNSSVEIHSGISSNDVSRGFGGLNAWQPLGVTAAAGEELMVYVGHSKKKTGEDAKLQLVATQYHAEAGAMSSVVASLKVGPNKVTVPRIWTTSGFESGGALYVQYTGGETSDRFAVRVSGGVAVPILDLYKVKDPAQRLEKTVAYVEELRAYVGRMQEVHEKAHQGSDNKLVKYGFDNPNCILGAADILLDTMMMSLPAQQILNGSGNGGAEEQAKKILKSMDAMEDMMKLFYQHKGLNANASEVLNRIPKGHLNIRYQRMFSGAFMYASGNHIGIEYPECAGMASCPGVVSDDAGRYQGGAYFGWGIAHEIGHCINQGSYAIAEITNNYFSVLAQAQDKNNTVRFQYDKVYEKVTSGAIGRASNVFTQLGMYWQLHLAYDRGYNYKTYGEPGEQLKSLFFARVDSYARNSAIAPAPGGVALTLSGDRDQILMRLGCAAAGKDILEFFERWGMRPDQATKKYAGQFPKETRAIYYANDDARAYSLQGGKSSLGTEGRVEAVGAAVEAAVDPQNASQVRISLSAANIPEADVLGYEIVRCMISGGVTQKEAVGFATGSSFTDTAYFNNRAVWYEVSVIDKYLNRSAAKALTPVKIQHDGRLDPEAWTVSVKNLASAEGAAAESGSGCTAGKEDLFGASAGGVAGAAKMVDGDEATVYTAEALGKAEITIDLHKTLTVAGFRYCGQEGFTGSYEVQIPSGGGWVTVASGRGAQTAYFTNEEDKGYVSTYETDQVRLILNTEKGQKLSVKELYVLGVTGDNVDFRRTGEGTVAIGKLKQDYIYDAKSGDKIPAGSIVFTGSYKGSPAYNVALLFDQSGNNVGGVDAKGDLKAHQIILASPPKGDIQNVSDGTWIYWIEPAQQAGMAMPKKVRAELYRVNNAQTNEGQRIVSDSMWEAVPSVLPEITLTGNLKNQ